MEIAITCVCKDPNCANHDRSPVIEINFLDGRIYWVCPKCRKTNILEIQKQPPKLPKTRLMR